MTPADQGALLARAQSGCQQARTELIRAYSPYVRKQVDKHQRADLRDDLMQAGLLGLSRAIDKYDPARGRFVHCAYHWVRDALQQERRRLDSHGFTGTNAHHAIQVRRGRKAKRDDQRPGEAARVASAPACVRAPIEAAARYGLGGEQDLIAALDVRDRNARLDSAVASLTVTQRRVLELRYLGGDATLREAGRKLGMTAAGVRKAERAALAQLRVALA